MTEPLVSFETAQLAKEKGFSWECKRWYFKIDGDNETSHYDSDSDDYNSKEHLVSRPTQSHLQKWLREVHKWSVLAAPSLKEGRWYFNTTKNHPIKWSNEPELQSYNTYEEALEQGLIEALKLIW